MKCDASDEFTTSTFLMFDWYSWLMRWKHALGAGALDLDVDLRVLRRGTTFATPSATFTSTDAYQTTLPSFSAAATIAGVVSWRGGRASRTRAGEQQCRR